MSASLCLGRWSYRPNFFSVNRIRSAGTIVGREPYLQSPSGFSLNAGTPRPKLMQGGLAQNGNGFSDGFDQAVGLIQGIVHREGSPRSCFDAKFLHEWLAAMNLCEWQCLPRPREWPNHAGERRLWKKTEPLLCRELCRARRIHQLLEAFAGSFQ